MNPESIISLQNLSCGYGHHYIIKNLSFDVNANDVVCLLGPNGVGKTTLFKTILGFLSPKGGNIFIKNKNMFWPASICVAAVLLTIAIINEIGRASCRERVSSPV